jgi:hypothetical protein
MPPKHRLLIHAVGVSAILILLFAGTYWQLIGKFQRDFRGMSEERVVSLLGKPDVDERQIYPERREEYLLGWYFYVGAHLGLSFRDGIVCDQQYGSK